MDVIRLFALFIGGIFGGLYGSTVGGGLLVSFPLLLILGIPTHVALGTQRLGAILGEFTSALKFHKAEKLQIKLAIGLGLTAAVGAIIGTTLVIQINEKILNIIIGIMLFIAALALFHKDKLGIHEHKITNKSLLLLFFCTLLFGIYGGFFGGGFGVFITILLVFFGFSFIESAAIGRVIGFCISVVSTIIFAKYELINYMYGITLGLGFATGSWIGITIALKKKDSYIKSLIFFVIILSIIKIILGFFNIRIFG